MTKIKDRRAGFYYLEDDKPYVSVSTILKIIAKPALMYWFGGEIYQAMANDPTLSKKEAFAAPYANTKESQNRGTAVHSIIEAWKNIDEVKGENSQYKGYAESFKAWLDDNEVEVLNNEKRVVSEEYKYAGTVDMVANVNGKVTAIDFKTGKDLYPSVHFQLSAYKNALIENGIEVERTMAVLINDDGTYKQEIGKDKFKGFKNALHLWADYNAEKCEKVGWEI